MLNLELEAGKRPIVILGQPSLADLSIGRLPPSSDPC